MRRIALLSLSIILVLSLVVCAFAEDEPLRVAWWGSESSNAIYLGVNDMFIEKTGIDTEPEYLSWRIIFPPLSLLLWSMPLEALTIKYPS